MKYPSFGNLNIKPRGERAYWLTATKNKENDAFVSRSKWYHSLFI